MNKKIEKLTEDDNTLKMKINELIDVVNGMQGEITAIQNMLLVLTKCESQEPDPFVKELEEMKLPDNNKFFGVVGYNKAIDDIISKFKGRVKIIK